MADLEYLEPDFDPTSLTIPKLRSLLVEYNVSYPSSAKKAQLVDLFEENIRPQAKRVLSARARTKPSTRGIKDVPSSQASVVDEDEAEAMAPPPTKSPVKRKPRRVTEGPVEMEEPTPRAPASASARRTSSKHARNLDADTDAQPQQRRSRKSAVKLEEPEPEHWHREDADSPFTSDNPFQSGSSPPAPEVSERRRRTLDPTEAKAKRKSSSSRRKTDMYTGPQTDGALVPTRKTFELPVSRLKQEEYEAVPAGEEFTPEEQLELVRARASSGEVDILPPRRKKAPSKAVATLKLSSGLGALATLLGLATLWRQEKFEVGYCGVGRPSDQIAGIDIPNWAEVIRPQCEPCPSHAYCYADLQTECEPDFVLRQHPLSLNGLLPLAPTCEPDSEKQRRVKAVADRAIEELRIRNAEYECGDLKGSTGKPAPSSAIPESSLKEAVSTKRRKGMSQAEFEALWDSAIGDIVARDEVTAGTDGTHRTLASKSLARVGFGCYVRRSVREALVRHLWQLVGALLVALSLSYGRYSITYGRRQEAEAKRLAAYAFDRLATQAALHASDGSKFPEGFISMANMRDDPALSKGTIGKGLWEKVQKKVEKNSNVRPMVREGRNGDVGRVWEWIGPVAAIEDGSASSRRQSGRYSLGTGYDSTLDESPYQVNAKPSSAGKEMVERRSWNEGRPVY